MKPADQVIRVSALLILYLYALNAIPYIMLKNGIDAIIRPAFIIKSERLIVFVCLTFSFVSGLLNKAEILIDTHRRNLTTSSTRTKMARIIFGRMVIINNAKP